MRLFLSVVDSISTVVHAADNPCRTAINYTNLASQTTTCPEDLQTIIETTSILSVTSNMGLLNRHSAATDEHKPSVRNLQARAYAAWVSQGTEHGRKSSASSFDVQRAAYRAANDGQAQALIMRS